MYCCSKSTMCRCERGDEPEVESQRERSDDERAEEVGPHQPAERHAARQHGDDLGLIGHLRGEEDTGDEGEQTAELIDEEGDEVEVIGEQHLLERRVRLGEVVDLLHVVEDDDDDDDHRDGEEVGREELAEYVAIQNLESGPIAFHLSFGSWVLLFAESVSCLFCGSPPSFLRPTAGAGAGRPSAVSRG